MRREVVHTPFTSDGLRASPPRGAQPPANGGRTSTVVAPARGSSSRAAEALTPSTRRLLALITRVKRGSSWRARTASSAAATGAASPDSEAEPAAARAPAQKFKVTSGTAILCRHAPRQRHVSQGAVRQLIAVLTGC